MAAGAADFDVGLAKARRQCFHLEEQLQRLEAGKDEGAEAIFASMNGLASDISRLEASIAAEADEMQRGRMRRKVAQVSENAQSLRRALEKHLGRVTSKQREADDRRELFRRRAAGANGDSVIEIGHAASELRSMHEASLTLDQLTSNGAAILGSLAGQSAVLRSSRMKIRSVFDALGLSNSLLRLIQRRQLMDQVLIVVGILAVSTLLYYVVFMRGSR